MHSDRQETVEILLRSEPTRTNLTRSSAGLGGVRGLGAWFRAVAHPEAEWWGAGHAEALGAPVRLPSGWRGLARGQRAFRSVRSNCAPRRMWPNEFGRSRHQKVQAGRWRP